MAFCKNELRISFKNPRELDCLENTNSIKPPCRLKDSLVLSNDF